MLYRMSLLLRPLWVYMEPFLKFSPRTSYARLSLQQTRYVAIYSEAVGNYKIRRLRRWTADELEIVDWAVKDGKSWRDLTELLPMRTPRSIKNRWDYQRDAAKSDHKSSNLEVQALLDFASTGATRDEIQKEFSHLPRHIINQRLRSRGIKLSPTINTTSKLWSLSEDDIVKQGIQGKQTAAERAKNLPGRTTSSIRVRMYRLTFTAKDVAPAGQPWTERDDASLLSQLASGKLVRDVAKIIGRSYYTTHNRLQTLRLRQKREADRSGDKA